MRKVKQQTKTKVSKTKKIQLGKAILEGKKQKMSLQELKALSRQIHPHQDQHKENAWLPDIVTISRNLRENLTRAKSKMMDSLRKSNAEKDIKIYEYLLMDDHLSTVPSSPNLSSSSSSSDYDDDEYDDLSSVTTTESTFQLKLVTSDSGSVSVVPSNTSRTLTRPTTPTTTADMFLPLYTPDFSSIMDMDFFFPKAINTTTTTTTTTDVTEDQINSWLQRGGFGDSMTPLTMATDQELAGNL